MCEREKFKAQWLNQAFGPIMIFDDMRCLGSGRGKDVITQEFQRVPKVSATKNMHGLGRFWGFRYHISIHGNQIKVGKFMPQF